MKKLILFSAFLIPAAGVNAQAGSDTLIWADFETDPSSFLQNALPPGATWDNSWYNIDLDQLPDQSPQSRPGEWFWTTPFSVADSASGNTGCLGSNSWTLSTSPVQNMLILPALYIADTTAMLSWKSAPYQTPRYLDGYQILISTTDNDVLSFTDTLFVASEFVSLDNANAPNAFTSYTFDPTPTINPFNPFVHGMDWAYIEDNADSSRWLGVLRPFALSLSQYSGMKIYIMFIHGTVDDNLLSIDEILVTGTGTVAVPENQSTASFTTFPNPTNGIVNMHFALASSSDVEVHVYDVAGKLVLSENKGMINEGETSMSLDLTGLPAGVYHIELATETDRFHSTILRH
jgi:hypothetical protein